MGGEVTSRKVYERRASLIEQARRDKLFRKLYPDFKTPKGCVAWCSPGINLHNRAMRGAKEKAITRLACYVAKAIRRGWKKNPPDFDTLYEHACRGVLGRSEPAQSPRKQKEWKRRVRAKVRAFVGGGPEGTPPPSPLVTNRLPSNTQTLNAGSTVGKRLAVLPWEGQLRRERARLAVSAPPAPLRGLVRQCLTSPPAQGLRADGVPAIFVGLMRSKLHLFSSSHWPGCRVEYSAPHVIGWGSRQLKAGKRLVDLMREYDAAVVRWHGRATDAGCRGAWNPAGMMADLYGRTEWIPTMPLDERVELHRKAADERERKASWRKIFAAVRPARPEPAPVAALIPVSAIYELELFRDLEGCR